MLRRTLQSYLLPEAAHYVKITWHDAKLWYNTVHTPDHLTSMLWYTYQTLRLFPAWSQRNRGGSTRSTYLYLAWASGITHQSCRYEWSQRWSNNANSLVSSTDLVHYVLYHTVYSMQSNKKRHQMSRFAFMSYKDREATRPRVMNSPLLAPNMSIILPGVHTMISAPLFSSAIYHTEGSVKEKHTFSFCYRSFEGGTMSRI